jgi:hypothetical protein
MFQRWTDEFQTLDYSSPLQGPFEMTTPLQAMMLEAGAKDKGIVVMAALVDKVVFFGVPETEEENDRPE